MTTSTVSGLGGAEGPKGRGPMIAPAMMRTSGVFHPMRRVMSAMTSAMAAELPRVTKVLVMAAPA